MLLAHITPFLRVSVRMSLPSDSCRLTSSDHRLFYIISGSGTVSLNGILFPFSPGSLMIWQAGTVYQIHTNEPTEVIQLCFDYTFENSKQVHPLPVIPVDSVSPPSVPAPLLFSDAPELNDPFLLNACPDLYASLLVILDEHLTQAPFYAEKTSTLLKSFLLDLLRRKNTFTEFGRVDDKAELILKYIKENYTKNLSSSFLSSVFNYHPYYINRIFTAAYGISLHQYVLNLRMTVAEQLLISTDDRISEIAYHLGFHSPVNFTSCFKKKNGFSPSEYRQKHTLLR